MTPDEAGKILFPKGFCVSTMNDHRCIIPATNVIDGRGFCDFHAEVLRAHDRIMDTLDGKEYVYVGTDKERINWLCEKILLHPRCSLILRYLGMTEDEFDAPGHETPGETFRKVLDAHHHEPTH